MGQECKQPVKRKKEAKCESQGRATKGGLTVAQAFQEGGGVDSWPSKSGRISKFFLVQLGLSLPTSSSMALLGDASALIRPLPAGEPGHPGSAYAMTSAQGALSPSSCLSKSCFFFQI